MLYVPSALDNNYTKTGHLYMGSPTSRVSSSKIFTTLWQEICRFWYQLVYQSDFWNKTSRTISDFGI